jgi:hypothetical protein
MVASFALLFGSFIGFWSIGVLYRIMLTGAPGHWLRILKEESFK